MHRNFPFFKLSLPQKGDQLRMQNEEAIELLKELISIPSLCGEEKGTGCYFYELETSQGKYCGKMVKVN